MATIGERREQRLDEDMQKAEAITRRQIDTASKLAAELGSSEPAIIASLASALAANFATIHSFRTET